MLCARLEDVPAAGLCCRNSVVPRLSQLGVTFPWHQAMSRAGGSGQALPLSLSTDAAEGVIQLHGQLCSLRLEGTCRAAFSSQLPLTPSLEPPSPAFWGLGGQGGDGAGMGQAASAEDSAELQALTLPTSPAPGPGPAPLCPAHGLSEL